MLRLIVCLSVISQCSIETADFRHRGCPQLILCCEGIQVSPTIRVLPSGNFVPNSELCRVFRFFACHFVRYRCCQLSLTVASLSH